MNNNHMFLTALHKAQGEHEAKLRALEGNPNEVAILSEAISTTRDGLREIGTAKNGSLHQGAFNSILKAYRALAGYNLNPAGSRSIISTHLGFALAFLETKKAVMV